MFLAGQAEKSKDGLDFFEELENNGQLGPDNLTELEELFDEILRRDLVMKVIQFRKEQEEKSRAGTKRKLVLQWRYTIVLIVVG